MPLLETIASAAARGLGLTSFSLLETDPYFSDISMLLSGNGNNNETTNSFIDSSSNAYTTTPSGSPFQGSFSPFGDRWSCEFNGSSKLNIGSTSAPVSWLYSSSTGSGTLEAWINIEMYKTHVNIYQNPCVIGLGGCYFNFGVNSTGQLSYYWWTGSPNVAAGGTVPKNKWTHIAMVKNGGGSNNAQLFIDGTSVLTFTLTQMSWDPASGGNNLLIGCEETQALGGSSSFPGYISNVRISNVARYTSNFTPSRKQFTSDANTTVLTCHKNRLVDDSSNNAAIVQGGNVYVRKYSPISRSIYYSKSSDGGSVWLGTTDGNKLSATISSTPNSNLVTAEAWVYLDSLNAQGEHFIQLDNASNSNIFLASDGTGLGRFCIRNDGGVDNFNMNAGTLPLRQWFHIAGVRSGSNASLYINGSRVATSSGLSNATTTGQIFTLGANQSNRYTRGYISNARIVSAAVYDPTQTTLTVPTEPFSNISNTNVLLKTDNAAIFDRTGVNNFRSEGEAVISTADKKYGSGSLYFDGSGNDYITVPWQRHLILGQGDFTIECWIKTSDTVGEIISAFDPASPYPGWLFGVGFGVSGKLAYYQLGVSPGSGSDSFSSVSTINDGTWKHVAATKSGSTLRFFINGTLDATHTLTASPTGSGTSIRIGADNNGSISRPLAAYIDDLRVTRGVARYTSSFTSPINEFAGA